MADLIKLSVKKVGIIILREITHLYNHYLQDNIGLKLDVQIAPGFLSPLIPLCLSLCLFQSSKRVNS